MAHAFRSALVLLLAAKAVLSAQSPDAAESLGTPPFSSMGLEAGLPSSSVSCIVQDSRGFLWFGTDGGLTCYDASRCRTFSHDPDNAASLPDNSVRSLLPDGFWLWIGTEGGLARLDLRSDQVSSYHPKPGQDDSLSSEVVTALCKDRAGRLWVGTDSGLNLLLDEKKAEFRRYGSGTSPGSLPSSSIRSLKMDSEGRLWIGMKGGGLARYNAETDSFISYSLGYSTADHTPDSVMAIAQGPQGKLWLAAWHEGLLLFNPADGSFQTTAMPGWGLYSLYASSEGSVFVGTRGGGLVEVDPSHPGLKIFRAASARGNLTSDYIYCLFSDDSGDLWIGTKGGGVCKLERGQHGLETIAATPQGLSSGEIEALLVDNQGDLWASAYGQGISRRDAGTGKWKQYRHSVSSSHSLPDDTVTFIKQGRDGSIWIGSLNGLARYDRALDSFDVIRPRLSSLPTWSPCFVYAMAEDEAGLWLALSRVGLVYCEARKAGGYSFKLYDHDPTRPDSLADDMVTSLAQDAGGRLWIGTQRGLDRYEGNGRFAHYLGAAVSKKERMPDSISALWLDARGALWIGTEGDGLLRYDSSTDSLLRYTTKDSLPSNTILSLIDDDQGSLWITTPSGSVVHDRIMGRIRPVSSFWGIQSYPLSAAVCRAKDGSLLFGSRDMIYHFDSRRYSYNVRIPRLVLSSITVAGKPALASGELYELEEGQKKLRIGWSDNDITFDFTALDYRSPEHNLYSYRLEGFDKAWSEPFPHHRAVYTNLPGGDYIFRVKASNNDGLWNEVGLSVPVSVGMAPWRTPLMYVLYCILLVAGGFGLATFLAQTRLYAAQAEAEGLRTRLVEASASMEAVAIVDSLTGLPNRRKAEELLDLALSRSIARKIEMALLFVDIDNFKAFNDQFGRAAGNDCLIHVARAVVAASEVSGGMAARFGGEEFLVIIEESGEAEAFAAGERIRETVAALSIPSSTSNASLVVTVSVGCAVSGLGESQSPANLIAAAERAMLAAKFKGRNRTST